MRKVALPPHLQAAVKQLLPRVHHLRSYHKNQPNSSNHKAALEDRGPRQTKVASHYSLRAILVRILGAKSRRSRLSALPRFLLGVVLPALLLEVDQECFLLVTVPYHGHGVILSECTYQSVSQVVT